MTRPPRRRIPEPPLISPEREAEIRARAMADSTKITNALAIGINAIVAARAEPLQAELDLLRVRVDRLEQLLLPEVEEGEG
jgi:hypothetical protein